MVQEAQGEGFELTEDTMKRTSALLATIILAPTFALASTPDRSCVKLLNDCHAAKKYIDNADPPHSTVEEKMKVATCVGYFAGFTDGQSLSDDGTKRFCPPTDANITAEEKILVFLQWADRNPQQLHIDRAACVTKAFAGAYPCPAQKVNRLPHRTAAARS
jgi:hypothetical protein